MQLVVAWNKKISRKNVKNALMLDKYYMGLHKMILKYIPRHSPFQLYNARQVISHLPVSGNIEITGCIEPRMD